MKIKKKSFYVQYSELSGLIIFEESSIFITVIKVIKISSCWKFKAENDILKVNILYKTLISY